MKILFVHSLSPHASQGGAEMSLRYLTEALAAQGHDCTVLCTGPEKGRRVTVSGGVREIRVGIRNLYWPFHGRAHKAPTRLAWHLLDSFNLAMQVEIGRIIDEIAPDVASVHNLPGLSVATWRALSQRDVPIVQVLHDQYLLCANGTMFQRGHNCRQRCAMCRALRLPHARLSRHVTAVVGVSRFILDRHKAFGLFRDTPLARVIHNARSAEALGVEQASAVPHERLRFGYIGSITPAKGVERLIRTFAGMSDIEADLWVAGGLGGAYAQALAEKTDDPRIRFVGRVAPAEFFSEIDVLILPSLWRDTFPGVAFESLIFGRPVIAAGHGGIPEIIIDGRNGLLYDPESETSLGSRMRQIAGDASLLAELGRQARLDGRYFLDTERWVTEYIDLYARAIEAAKSGHGRD